jgi:hypothetical protein
MLRLGAAAPQCVFQTVDLDDLRKRQDLIISPGLSQSSE